MYPDYIYPYASVHCFKENIDVQNVDYLCHGWTALTRLRNAHLMKYMQNK